MHKWSFCKKMPPFYSITAFLCANPPKSSLPRKVPDPDYKDRNCTNPTNCMFAV